MTNQEFNILSPPGNCKPFCTGCTGYGCEWCDEGTVGPPGWFYKESNCWQGNYTSPGYDIINCANEDAEGNRFQIQHEDDTYYCYDDGFQDYGDPWCPLNYYYESGFCKRDTEVCDQGYPGNYMVGCDNPYTPQNDHLYNQYQEECVDTQVVGSPSYLYDSMCCYDSVFNGFEIFQWGTNENYIKVY